MIKLGVSSRPLFRVVPLTSPHTRMPCTFYLLSCLVIPSVASLIAAMHAAKKPIGALYIAPVLLVKLLGTANGMPWPHADDGSIHR